MFSPNMVLGHEKVPVMLASGVRLYFWTQRNDQISDIKSKDRADQARDWTV